MEPCASCPQHAKKAQKIRNCRAPMQFFRGEELANDRSAKIFAICEHVRGGVIYDRMFEARTIGDTDKR
eukprot:1988363-Prymnesium_polylepis.1